MQQDVESKNHRYDEAQTLSWLKLTSIARFGAASLSKLRQANSISCPEELFALDRQQLLLLGFNADQINNILHPDIDSAEQSLHWLQSDARRFILHIDHSAYPALLKEISRPPLLLYGYGNPDLLASAQIAIVGSRNPSLAGKQSARAFARSLSLFGWTITSGLALGIDGLAHQGALQADGKTIAVLGTGVEQIYPKKHQQLAEQIKANHGVIVSEFSPMTTARAEHFPRRNRIISGLSRGTLIVEAALKSGSLITARYALEQNREVFAVPGNINNPLSAGCHHLIQQGAKLVTHVDDINEEFSAPEINICFTKQNKTQKICIESLATDRLLDSVDFEATPLDIVAERSDMTVSEVMSQLLEYELRGLVAAVPGGYIKLGEK